MYVRSRHERGIEIPVAPARACEVGRDPDEGSRANRCGSRRSGGPATARS
jgi:hypothetical protein